MVQNAKGGVSEQVNDYFFDTLDGNLNMQEKEEKTAKTFMLTEEELDIIEAGRKNEGLENDLEFISWLIRDYKNNWRRI